MENLDERFDDLPRFEDQVTAFLKQSGEMRIFLREASTEVKGDHAVLIADAEMVYTSKANLGPQQRRKERIQFDFKDRKSTRLNSSHGSSSYAVFCLKKKRY